MKAEAVPLVAKIGVEFIYLCQLLRLVMKKRWLAGLVVCTTVHSAWREQMQWSFWIQNRGVERLN